MLEKYRESVGHAEDEDREQRHSCEPLPTRWKRSVHCDDWGFPIGDLNFEGCVRNEKWSDHKLLGVKRT